MKATSLLVQQHKKVKGLFKKLESKTWLTKLENSLATPEDRVELLHELANDLIAHMAIEHEIFYPAVVAIDPGLIGESVEEHALAELAIKRLLKTDPSSAMFTSRVTAAKELVEHHAEGEEEELFPKVEKKLGDKKLEELGKLMKQRFDEVKEAGFEGTAPKGAARTLADAQRSRALGSKKRAA